MADDAELRLKLTEMGVDVGPIDERTRALYRRMLRKRQNEHRASAVGSAAKKLKPAPPSPSAASSPSAAPRPAKPRPAAANSRRTGAVRSRKVHGNKVGGASRPAIFIRPSAPSLPSSPPPQLDRPPPCAPPSPRIYPLLPPLPYSHPPPSPPSPPYQKAKSSLSPSLHRNDSGSSVDYCPPTPPISSRSHQASSSSSTSSTDSGTSGVVNTITSWLGSRVKGIINRIQEAASPAPRRPLSKVPSHSSPTPSAPPQHSPHHRPHVSPNSISIDELDIASDPDSSPGSVYLLVPSPLRDATKSQQSPGAQPGPSGARYDWELWPEEVQICKKRDGELWLLGKGGCGQVYRGLKDGVDDVAVKVIRLQSCEPLSAVAQFKKEIDTISRLRHRHVLQFYGACVQPSCLFMVTELMDTDLFSALRERGSKYTWAGEHGREVMLGIASGLHHLHSRRPPIVHRDIKSPNVLVMGGLAKLADVGVANTMAATDMTAQRGFTIAWAAPEVILRKRANEKIDIWSLGIVLWEVVSGKVPRPGQLVFPPQAPPPLRSLYSSCTSDSPSSRPSAAQVIHALKLPEP